MKRDIISSAIGIIALTLLMRDPVPARHHRREPGGLPRQRQRPADQGRRQGHRLEDHREQFALQVVKNGKPVVDKNGNPVTVPDPRYFQSRPSGTTPPYNAGATTFANLGPNSVLTEQAISANVKAYLALEKPYDRTLTEAQIPVDAVNTSASGVDPDISQANADIQAHRVAAVRHLPLATVRALDLQVHLGPRPRVLR